MKRNNLLFSAALLATGSMALASTAAAGKWTRVPDRPDRVDTTPVRPFISDRSDAMMQPLEKAEGRAVFGDQAPTPLAQKMLQSPSRRAQGATALMGEIYGVANTFAGQTSSIEDYEKSFFGKINFENFSVQPLYSGINFRNTVDTQLQTGAVRDGILYIPEGVSSNARDFEVIWKRFDINQGKWLEPLRCADNASVWMMSMCYDPVTDAFYGMAALEDAGSMRAGRIVRVDLDPVTGLPKETVLRDLPATAQLYSGFFFDPSTQRVMVFTDGGTIYEFRRENGTLISVCEIFVDDPADQSIVFPGFENRGTAHLVYSPRDKKVLMMVPEPGVQLRTYIYSIDMDEGSIVREGEIQGGYYLTALYTTDTFAEPEAAAQPTISAVNLVRNELSGSIDIVVPNTLYNGLELTSNVTLVAEVDGKQIYSAEAAPGASVNVPFSLEEGVHKFSFRADLPKLKGPEITVKKYVGNDIPKRPTNVAVDGTTITWNAPDAVGFNQGFVDTDDLTYDLYFGETKLNSSPVKGTSFTFNLPDELQRVYLTVTATAHGKTSLASEPIDFVTGSSIGLPYTATPELAQSKLLTVIDGNHDGNSFEYDPSTKEMVHEYDAEEGSNEWLILPALNITDVDKMHKFSVDFRTVTPYYGTESIELCIGEKPNAASMRKLISFADLQTADSRKINLNTLFNVDKPGTYYLAVHATSKGEGAGSKISNLSVQALQTSTAVPAQIATFNVKAAEYGDLFAIFNVTIPTLDAAGKPLADKDVTVKISNFSQNSDQVVTAKGRPGQSVTVECPSTQGFNAYLISCENEFGEGAAATVRQYVGIDTPSLVENLTKATSEDNMSMKLSWSPVTTGVNGGFIDPDNLLYQVWYNPQGVTWNMVGSPFKETEVVFSAAYDVLSNYRVSVFAQNSAGFLKTRTVDNVVTDILGKPIEFPMQEKFGSAGSTYRWFYDRRTEGMETSFMQQVGNTELSYLGIGNPKFDDGSGRIVSNMLSGQACQAELSVPKFSTVNQTDPTFRMRYWNHEDAPSFKILAKKYGQETPAEIFSWKPNAASYRSWDEVTFAIPEEYHNQKWVALYIRFDIPASTKAYGVIDDIEVFSMVDIDFKTSSIVAEPISHIGDDCVFEVTFTNAGQERQRGRMIAEVIADGKVTDRQEKMMRGMVNSLASYTDRFTFTAKPEYLSAKDVVVRFSVNQDGDQIPANNSMETNWEILPSVTPIVTDLYGDFDGEGNTALTWSEPRQVYGAFDDFEYMTPFEFGEKFGQWTNLDRDNLQNYIIGALKDTWKDQEVKKAWQVVNDEMLGTKGDASLGAHSGKQFLVAMAGFDPQEGSAAQQVSDWLISPEVVGGTTVKFWMNILDPNYRETLHIYYSTTDNKPESFIKLCNRSKEHEVGWEQTSFELPSNAKYFAIVYVGWDTLGVCIDDLEFTPANPDYWTIDSYDVYRMQTEPAEKEYTMLQNVTTPGFTDKYTGNDTYYYVKTRASYNGYSVEGPVSNIICVGPSGVSNVEALEGVFGGKGEIRFIGHEGKTAKIFAADGKMISAAGISESAQSVKAEPGIHIVMIGNKAAKVIVR